MPLRGAAPAVRLWLLAGCTQCARYRLEPHRHVKALPLPCRRLLCWKTGSAGVSCLRASQVQAHELQQQHVAHGHLIVCPLLGRTSFAQLTYQSGMETKKMDTMRLKAPFLDASLELRTLVAAGRECAGNNIIPMMALADWSGRVHHCLWSLFKLMDCRRELTLCVCIPAGAAQPA